MSQQTSLRWDVSTPSASANEETELCVPGRLTRALLLSGSLILGMEGKAISYRSTGRVVWFGAEKRKLVLLPGLNFIKNN